MSSSTLTKNQGAIVEFNPLFGIKSPHLQMITAVLKPAFDDFPSKINHIKLEDKDIIAAQETTPFNWQPSDPICFLVHGLGGSDQSNYMVRAANRLFEKGIKSIRINARGCGRGAGLSKLPYHGGRTEDIWSVIDYYQKIYPLSQKILVGFSFGGNLVLKLTGELEEKAQNHLLKTIAICPVLDLRMTMYKVADRKNWLYEKYYIYHMLQDSRQWTHGKKINSFYEYDNVITAPKWGFKNADEYYSTCSSLYFLPKIQIPTKLLFSLDDPFIDPSLLDKITLPENVKVDYTLSGSHLGFLGSSPLLKGPYWMDSYLMNEIMEAV